MKRIYVHDSEPRGVCMLCDKYLAYPSDGGEPVPFNTYNHIYAHKPLFEHEGRPIYPRQLGKLEVWDRDEERWCEVDLEVL